MADATSAPMAMDRAIEDAALSDDESASGSDDESSFPVAMPSPDDLVAVVKQIEFYFSDANLPSDRKLLKSVKKDPEGFVPVKLFANFRKVRAITKDVAVITEALKVSRELVLSEDMKRVKRKIPVPDYDVSDIQRRIVVVENLPPSPTIDSVTALFARFGTVKLVRICSKDSKGKLPNWLTGCLPTINQPHAFIEYANEESAIMAVAALHSPDDWKHGLQVRRLLHPSSAAEDAPKHAGRPGSRANSRPPSNKTSREPSPAKGASPAKGSLARHSGDWGHDHSRASTSTWQHASDGGAPTSLARRSLGNSMGGAAAAAAAGSNFISAGGAVESSASKPGVYKPPGRRSMDISSGGASPAFPGSPARMERASVGGLAAASPSRPPIPAAKLSPATSRLPSASGAAGKPPTPGHGAASPQPGHSSDAGVPPSPFSLAGATAAAAALPPHPSSTGKSTAADSQANRAGAAAPPPATQLLQTSSSGGASIKDPLQRKGSGGAPKFCLDMPAPLPGSRSARSSNDGEGKRASESGQRSGRESPSLAGLKPSSSSEIAFAPDQVIDDVEGFIDHILSHPTGKTTAAAPSAAPAAAASTTLQAPVAVAPVVGFVPTSTVEAVPFSKPMFSSLSKALSLIREESGLTTSASQLLLPPGSVSEVPSTPSRSGFAGPSALGPAPYEAEYVDDDYDDDEILRFKAALEAASHAVPEQAQAEAHAARAALASHADPISIRSAGGAQLDRPPLPRGGGGGRARRSSWHVGSSRQPGETQSEGGAVVGSAPSHPEDPLHAHLGNQDSGSEHEGDGKPRRRRRRGSRAGSRSRRTSQEVVVGTPDQGNSEAGAKGKQAPKADAHNHKKLTKKDYAAWAAATPEYRAAATARYAGAQGTPPTYGSPGGPGLFGRAHFSDGGMVHHEHAQIAKGPDGISRGFGMGRGKPVGM